MDHSIWSSDSLIQDEQGIWRRQTFSKTMSEPEAVFYPVEGSEITFELEDRSFWYRHRNKIIETVIERFPYAGIRTQPFLDVGGGNGVVSAHLQSLGHNVVVVEPGAVGAGNARRRGVRTVIHALYQEVSWLNGFSGALGLFDVIEHVSDEVRFLRELGAPCASGASLYVTVPAYGWLWSADDQYGGHFRRYSQRSLLRALEAAGWRPRHCSYFFSFLPPLIFLARTVPYWLKLSSSPESVISSEKAARDHAPGSVVLDTVLDMEVRRLRAGTLPFGSSLIVVAEKM